MVLEHWLSFFHLTWEQISTDKVLRMIRIDQQPHEFHYNYTVRVRGGSVQYIKVLGAPPQKVRIPRNVGSSPMVVNIVKPEILNFTPGGNELYPVLPYLHQHAMLVE